MTCSIETSYGYAASATTNRQRTRTKKKIEKKLICIDRTYRAIRERCDSSPNARTRTKITVKKWSQQLAVKQNDIKPRQPAVYLVAGSDAPLHRRETTRAGAPRVHAHLQTNNRRVSGRRVTDTQQSHTHTHTNNNQPIHLRHRAPVDWCSSTPAQRTAPSDAVVGRTSAAKAAASVCNSVYMSKG